MSKVFTSSGKNLFKQQLIALKNLSEALLKLETYEERCEYVQNLKEVSEFMSTHDINFIEKLNSLDAYLILSTIAIGQGHVLQACEDDEARENLLVCLRDLESFFSQLGGVVGYQLTALELLQSQELEKRSHEIKETFYPPQGFDLTRPSKNLDESIICGILSQDKIAEIYPVGGAADRLNLQDDKTYADLPAACLDFLGRTLLEGIIRDVQAREYLYYKLTGRQVTTPIALMTSEEKRNDAHIRDIFVEKNFFGRSQESFKFFIQPLVPTFTRDGVWCLKDKKTLLCKPGGHGVLWKIAKEKGILEWIKCQKKTKVLIRQINNPIAGVDFGLSALIGLGMKTGKCFGFASCLRRLQTNEGINILKETRSSQGFNVVLSNIEYCDFKKFNIEDAAQEEGSLYSVFPSNTNILFADISSIEEAVEKCPYPGRLVNFKEMTHLKNNDYKKEPIARVELLMQNIADGFVKTFSRSVAEEPYPDVRAFMTFNKRHKTISPTKKQFIPGSGLIETAFGCFYDYLKNMWELMTEKCQFTMPDLVKEEEFLKYGPSFMMSYHPALGPLYSVIQKKINKGCFSYGSELQLEIAELKMNHLDLDGSLIIKADQVLGHINHGIIEYSNNVGLCILKNVKVVNQGIDRTQNNIFWKNKIYRHEALNIHLKGKSLFIAENVEFKGNIDVIVENDQCVIAESRRGKLLLKSYPLKDFPLWKYSVSPQHSICLD